MIMHDNPSSQPGSAQDPALWPVVSPEKIVIAKWDWDLAYMGVYLRLEICNRSPYLVREAELRIDGHGPTFPGIVTSRELHVGPLFPGVYVHEEVGIGARGGISGLTFNYVSAHAVRLTPPAGMVPATEYPALAADVVDVTVDKEAPDLRRRGEDVTGEPPAAAGTAICIRMCNGGPAVVERARLKLLYFEGGPEEAGSQPTRQRKPVAEWILDMPHREWNPYQLPAAPDAACDPADPLPPGQAYEFTLVHYDGGPHRWAGSLDTTSVEVCELKLRSATRSTSG